MTTIQYPSQVQLLINSADRNFAVRQSSTDPIPLNNFVITKNQNLIQGQFHRLTLTSLRFPWQFPNITRKNNVLWASFDSGVSWNAITITPGFWDGTDLALIIQTLLRAVPGGSATLDVSYSIKTQQFSISDSVATSLTLQTYNPLTQVRPPFNSPSLLKTMGYLTFFNIPLSLDLSDLPLISGVAPLTYTDYIDICSEQLTLLQSVKDMPTTQGIPRQSVIVRVYLADENSQNSPTDVKGTYPFIIHRQFTNPKVIRWENDRSVGQIDIQLYDMYGDLLELPIQRISNDPLLFTESPLQDFQINFLCSED
jgi:hypothetical protein